MKKAMLTGLVLSLVFSGTVLAQDAGDEVYIKAMQAGTPAQRAPLLKDFLAKFSGKGNKYENFANANLCIDGWPGKSEQETITYGEKALSLGGLDDLTKIRVLMNITALYNKQGQNLDKAKTYANQIIQITTAAKGKEGEQINWSAMVGAGYFLLAKAQDKNNETKAAADSYINSFNILKDPKILAEIKKAGKKLYEAKDYADAEKIFRFFSQVNPRDFESSSLIGQSLYRAGKTQEALKLFKEIHAKQRSGEMAYNIGIILAKEAKANPVLGQDAIRYLLDAALIYPAQSKKAMELAESLYYGSDKEWNVRVKKIQESNQLIEEWTKMINTKFGNKSEDELTTDEKREYRKIKENIDAELKAVEKIQAQQKATMDGFNKLLGEAKQRMGINK